MLLGTFRRAWYIRHGSRFLKQARYQIEFVFQPPPENLWVTAGLSAAVE
jgi:hypothetical protein